MSGLEAVSLALAVFPLVIGLLERYQDGCEKLRDWVLFRREFAKLVNDLNREQIIFRQHVEGTLRSVANSEFEMVEMMEDAQDPRWKSDELTQRFKRKLCGNGEYENYLFSIKSIHENLADMSRKLKRCGSSDDLSGAAARKRYEIQKQFRRLQFSIGKKRWQEQVVDLGRQIDRVGKLYVEAEALAPSRQSRTSTTVHKAFRLVRCQAASLHKAISKAWTCGCEDSHTFQLLMDGRSRVAASQRLTRRPLTISFPLRSRAWAMPEVSLDDGDSWCAFQTTMVSPADSGSPFLAIPAGLPRGPGSFLSDASSPSSTRTASTTLSAASTSATRSSGSLSSHERLPSRGRSVSVITVPDNPTPIKDLCRVIRVGDGDLSAACLEDGQGSYHVLRASPPLSFTSAEVDRVVSLERILTSVTERRGGARGGDQTAAPAPELSRRHRMSIALTLAYAMLELYPTPWLPQFCNKTAVHLFQHRDGQVLAEHPFVLCEATVRHQHGDPDPDPDPDSDARAVSRESDHSNALLALGIVIMELWFGQTIESRSFWDKCCNGQGNETEYTSLMAAMEWQKKAKDEAGVVLHDITSRCIRGNLGLATINLYEAECVDAVYDYIVKPLEALLSHCWPM
ncbi:hypothetical protein B0T25DRAFT_493605 [Lasiosphaeria hispida]|uniref:DUF7580 domain-containing protein n=1 Tax=Lasiosphaeria hispida TaxID=260671 RepID=A0AAJ0HXE2_9PEZI|nr:hypothetical protein B0T25DRAFT_493605 [Lasiosphaeria hispida]